MEIRLFSPEDAEQIAQLFHDTIRQINSRDYTAEQVQAWAPDDIHFIDWAERGSSRIIYVADDQGTIAGFAELEPQGHIDCFYCHKDYQRRGVGRQLYQAIETKAKQLGLKDLNVEASITARPFFQQMGFSVVNEQQVICRGVTFTNYVMGKKLRS
jgi:putative acetyltransferase